MILIFLGAPGAGKGTQAAVISQKLGLAHIASGDLFRQAVDEGTELGKSVKSYMDEGALVPDEVTIRLISERLDKSDCKSGCVFDGFPRNTEQARALDRMLAGRGEAIDEAIYIEVPEKELLKRLTGRWVCRKCQAPYHEVTAPPKVRNICDKCGGEMMMSWVRRIEEDESHIKFTCKKCGYSEYGYHQPEIKSRLANQSSP